jgi:cell wall-associated NlpC family hydrolase
MSTRSRSLLSSLALVAVLSGLAGSPAVAAFGEDDRRPRGIVTTEAPAPTKGERAVKAALSVVGTRYQWGGESPATGFDCSGLVRWAYGRVGIELPHNSYALYGEGRRVRESRMEPGDILFFEGLGHVGLYLGNGRMVHSPETGRTVEVVRLGATNYGARLIGARRVIAE